MIKNILKILGLKYAQSSEATYEDKNRLVEQISGILYVAFTKVVPHLAIWPQFVISFVKYFATDLNGAAFELPIPAWYVCN